MGGSRPHNNDAVQWLDQFVREARLARGMSRRELGEPELSEAYIEALERDAVLPSQMALEALARHFRVPAGELLKVPARLDEPDVEAFEEDLNLQLNAAQSLADEQLGDEAMQVIDAAKQQVLPYIEELSWRSRYRIHHLRSIIALQAGKLPEAQSHIQQAIAHIGSDLETVGRAHNLAGVVHYLQGNLEVALEEHMKALHAVDDGKVKNRYLRLGILRNLANAHWGLNEYDEAIRFYNEALKDLGHVNDRGRLAGVYWGMAAVYHAQGKWAEAKMYGLRALEIYEERKDKALAATMRLLLAELSTEDRQYEAAAGMLKHAKQLLEGTDELVLRGTLYRNLAYLARAEGRLDDAAEFAGQSITHGEAGCEKIPTRDMQTRGTAVRALAENLYTAARIEEERLNTEAADRLFKKAIATIEQTSFEETRSEIIHSYAETLSKRGAHQEANKYYQVAIKLRSPSRLRAGVGR